MNMVTVYSENSFPLTPAPFVLLPRGNHLNSCVFYAYTNK